MLKWYFLQALYQSAQHIYENGKDPDPYIWLMDPDPDPGGPKTCGSPILGQTVHVAQVCSLSNSVNSMCYCSFYYCLSGYIRRCSEIGEIVKIKDDRKYRPFFCKVIQGWEYMCRGRCPSKGDCLADTSCENHWKRGCCWEVVRKTILFVCD